MTTVCSDFQVDGLWAKYTPCNGGKPTITQAYCTYNHIAQRTKAGGKEQARNPAYIRCQNGFESFQAFADWVVQQVGYAVPGHELDKDLLVPGNKVYSQETCCFLPKQINLALQRGRLNKKSGLPVGISPANKNGLRAKISIDGKKVFLASTATDTHENRAFLSAIYEKAKSAYLHQLAERFRDQIDPRAYQALLSI